MRKSILGVCFAVLTFTFVNSTAFAQIKIPTIFKPKQTQPIQTPTPQMPTTPSDTQRQSGEQSGKALQPGESYIDDGFTWFEAVSFEETVNGTRGSAGWALKSSIRLIGEFPDRSAFKIVIARAGKPVTTNRCPGFSTRLPANSVGVSFMWTVECWKKDTATKESGKFDVQIFAINGDTDAETLVRTYKIDVRTVDRISGPTTKPIPDAQHYYISRHAEAPVSLLFLRPGSAYSYIGYDRADRVATNSIDIYYNLSPTKEGKGVPHGYLRCSVDGKRLQMPGPMPFADQAISTTDRRYEVIYSDRLGAQYKAGPVFQDPVEFTMVRLTLPLTYGDKKTSNRLSMKDYPGNWECSLMNNGETWRTWRWKVGSDGMPVKHAEQNGNINLYYNTYLIDTEIPAAGTILDKRLVPVSLAEGLFYGQKWTSPEGKAMAGKVPTKGNPHPVPSNKIK